MAVRWGLDVEFVEPVKRGSPLLSVHCIVMLAVSLGDEVKVSFVSCGMCMLLFYLCYVVYQSPKEDLCSGQGLPGGEKTRGSRAYILFFHATYKFAI